jgi:hypothetical protein
MTPGKCLVCAIEIPTTKPYKYACGDCFELMTAFVDACERAGGTLEIDATAAMYVDSKDAGVQLVKEHFVFVAMKLQELVEEINKKRLRMKPISPCSRSAIRSPASTLSFTEISVQNLTNAPNGRLGPKWRDDKCQN